MEQMLSEHKLEPTGQLAFSANIDDGSNVPRSDFASTATVDHVYGNSDQHLFSSQEPITVLICLHLCPGQYAADL
jgi:hypothetical protein